tara:strand:- start:1027 stop:1389 length:363 start_codon:yes stop_codon:yes gene_type:complete
MSTTSLLTAPLSAAVASFLIKVVLNICSLQPFNLRGHPSGHTAVIVALIIMLWNYMPLSSYAFAVAVVFGSLYLSDILLMYYGVIPSVTVDNRPLGHSWQEIATGAMVGALVGLYFVQYD